MAFGVRSEVCARRSWISPLQFRARRWSRSVGRSAGLPARVHFARFVEITHIFASSRVTIICNSPTGPRGAEGAILSECICSTYLETTIEEVPIIADMNVHVEFVDYLTQVGIMRFESQRGRGIGGEGIIMRRSKEESDALIYSRCRPRRNVTMHERSEFV